MSDRPLRLSVVIPHLNQPEALARCLAALRDGRRQPDEVTVVDNGSSRLPDSVVAAHPGVRLLAEPVPGPGPARNRGAGASTGDVLAFIDADCLADPDWLAGIEAAFADPGTQVIGGDVRVGVADPARLTMVEAYESIFGYQVERYIRDKGFTVTCNLAMRPAVFAAVGPFAGLAVAEDIDWGHRATAMGYRIRYAPAIRIFHPARASFADLWKKWDRHMAHFFVEAQSRPRGRLLWAARTAAMAVSPLAALPQILTSDRVSGLRNRALAFLGLLRIRLYRAGVMLWLLFGGDPATLSQRWNRPPQ